MPMSRGSATPPSNVRDGDTSIDTQYTQGKVRVDSINEEERTVEVVFTTGQAGKRYHWDIGYYMEELEVSKRAINVERLEKGLPVIDNHETYQGIKGVQGITREFTIDEKNGELIGTVFFPEEESVERTWQLVRQGVLKHWSLGYDVTEYRATVNPDDGDLDNYLATSWMPTELSIVPVSFETNNGIRNKADAKNLHQLTIIEDESMKNKRNGQGLINDPQDGGASSSPASIATNTPAPGTENRGLETPAPATPAPAPAATTVDPMIAQNARNADLNQMVALCTRHKLDTSIAITAFTENKTMDETRQLILDELAAKSDANVPAAQLGGSDTRDHNATVTAGITNLLLKRTQHGANLELDDVARQFTGMSMREIARAHMNTGQMIVGESATMFAQRVFHSTSDFPKIFENVMHKSLQHAYESEQQTWRDLGRRASVTDFRDKHIYKLGDAPDLLPLGENGEYKAGTFGESKEKYRISTFARKIGFSRQMFINDDMSALDMLPTMWGMAGNRLESDIVWGMLLNKNFMTKDGTPVNANIKMDDGKALFHAEHGNLQDGANSVFGKKGFSGLRQAGHKTKTLDGKRMQVRWNNLVLPYELEDDADELLASRINATQTDNVNIWSGKFGYRVEPRLSDVSATSYLAFTNQGSAFEYAYLEGNEGMYTETNQSTDVDGMSMLVRHDFGAGLAEHRYINKSAGQ